MVRLYPAHFRKDQLSHVPREALLYHLVIAQIANEAIIFRKLGIASLSGTESDSIAEKAAVAITHLMIAMSAARLLEARTLLNNNRFKAVRETIHPLMDKEGRNAYRSVNRYFGKANSLHGLRNKVAFHFDIGVAERAMEGIQSDQDLIDYHAETYGNSFYGSGAVLTAFQLATVAGPNVGMDHFGKLLEEIRAAVHWFEVYAASFLMLSAQHYLGADISQMERDKIEIIAPDIRTVTIPYFMDDGNLTGADFE